MAEITHFNQIPLLYNAGTDTVSSPSRRDNGGRAGRAGRTLEAELAELAALHRALLQLEVPTGVPPPPIPVNPRRTAQVTKLKESGSAELRKGSFAEADRMYSLALKMALGRPHWEPSALAREECALLLANRAQARMAGRRWPEAAVDAEASVEARRQGNAKAWWRRGRCLLEMGRLEEAREWVSRALEVEGDETELVALRDEVNERIGRAAGAS